MDIAEFQLVRSPRLHTVSEVIKGDTLVPSLEQMVRDMGDPSNADMQDLIDTRMKGVADPIVAGGLTNPDTILQCVYWVLARLGEKLEARNDRVSGQDLANAYDKLSDVFRTRFGDTEWRDALIEAGGQLEDWLAAALVEKNLGRAADLTRLWSLLRLETLEGRIDLTAAEVQARLALVPHFPGSLATLFQQASIQLVREATVADLYVVRSEWRQYVRGDIAGIKNVLPGEEYVRTLTRTQELETTQDTESQTQTSTESEQKTSEESEMSRETTNQLHVEIAGFVRAEVQASYGTASIKVSGGVEGRVSLDQAERQASRVARSATNRAVSKVDQLTREARTRRELSRTEDVVREALTNTKAEFVRGIYRWLDRVDRFQIVRYPDRLQLEFQLPEPGEYLRWRGAQQKQRDGMDAPPNWDINLDDISEDADALLALAKTYHAVNLPTPPAAEVSVVHAVKADAKGVPTDLTPTPVVPLANEEVELLVPGGYEAVEVSFGGVAVPVYGRFLSEIADGTNVGQRDGYHGSVVTVTIAGKYWWRSNQANLSTAAYRDDAVVRSLGWDENRTPRFGNAVTEVNGGAETTPVTVALDPPAVAKVRAAVQGAGVSAVDISFTMKCRRSSQAYGAWRQAVYDALFEAWIQWKRDWETEQGRAAGLQLITGAGSAAKVEEMLRNEVKRQVIAWLLDESPFQGRNGLRAANAPSWREIDFDLARQSAAIIQFFEQAFEWGNLNYVLYPYYWAERARWDTLNEVSAANPDLERFLKAGSARVVVPARPAMASAVLHWLAFREPFLGRPLPLPGDPLFVSLAQEIRDLTQPPTDGELGDSWEARVGTSLMWLEDTDTLPVNELASLGAPPHEPDPRLTPVA
jgi:hypothetical protein